MAKQIKVIKCPQCGSVDKTEIKPDMYRCNSCHAEYFLDNDDININHTFNTNTPPNFSGNKTRIFGYVVAGIFAFFILFNLFFSGKKSTSPTYSTSESSVEEEAEDKWSSSTTSFYESASKKPIFVVVGYRSTSGFTQKDQKTYAGFYAAEDSEEISIQELPVSGSSSNSIDFQEFENGNLYCIINKAKLFLVDKQFNKLNEVAPSTYTDLPDLQTGIAQIEFAYEGDGFKTMSNEGKEIYYFPNIKKTYNKDAYYKAQNAKNTPRGTTKIAFSFTGKSSSYPDEKIQLIKYKENRTLGYPFDYPRFGWEDDYGGSGFFTDADPHKKVLITDYSINRSGLLSFSDFTPNRLYFDPRIITSNQQIVLISYRATPAENAPKMLQLLDANTAKVIWTYPLTDDLTVYEGAKVSSGYFIEGSPYNLFLDNNGKLVQKFKI